MSFMPHFAPEVSVASQKEVWVGPELLQRSGGPRMSMVQLYITHIVQH